MSSSYGNFTQTLLETLQSTSQTLTTSYWGPALGLTLFGYGLLRHFVITGATTNGEQQDMRGRIVMITGATSGIGLYTATVLYRQGAKVYLACRNEEKTRQVIQEIKQTVRDERLDGGSLHFVKMVLDDLESVKEGVDEFLKTGDVLDVLINNAGCVSKEIEFTKQGFETMFQSNALGHHLLIELLWSNLEKNPRGARIVVVASMAHMFVNNGDFTKIDGKYTLANRVKNPRDAFSSFGYWDVNKQYGFSKLCNIFQVKHLHETRVKNNPNCKITINCCHPGAIQTGLTREMPTIMSSIFALPQLLFFKNVKQGSQNTLHLACSDDVKDVSGLYFDDCKPAATYQVALNKDLQDDYARIAQEAIQPYL